MAGRRSGLRRLLRPKRKREGPGAASAQQPEEMQHFQALQQDPGQNRTEEQDHPRGCFRRAVQRFLKFMGIRRRTSRTTPPEVLAEPDTRTTEIEEKPDVSTVPINHMETSDTAVTEDMANPDTALANLTVKDDIELSHYTAKPDTSLADDTSGSDTAATDVMAKADVAPMPTDGTSNSEGAPMGSTAKPDTALADDRTGTDNDLLAKADIAPMPIDGTSNSHGTPMGGTAKPDTALSDDRTSSDTDIVARADITPMPTDGTSSSATAPMDDTAKPETALTLDTINAQTEPTDLMAEGDATTESIGNDDSNPTQSVIDAPNLDFLVEKGVSSRKKVPAIVRYIHQCLTFHVSPDVRQHIDIRSLADTNPHEVVMTLLRCAPACDRAAAVMWSSIASSGTTVEKVLPTLLEVMEDWPVHTVSTCDGDDTDIFALAATLALWLIIQEPKCQEALMSYAPQFLVALLFQIFMSTEQMPEDVNTFWRGCQEQYGLLSNPSRFAVQTLKALLCRLHWENEVVAVERKCGWETLLCWDTHHYAVGLLAREMRGVLVPFHSQMTIHLLGLLSRDQPRWELPALAFLVELLDYLDGRECHDRVLPILSRNLQSQCPDRRRLALRGLLVLSVDPSMAESICSLAESLLELLHHEDGELVGMTLSVFLNVLRDEDLQAFSSAAPKLAEALRPLFDNDNSHVQLLSIRLFREMMEFLAEEGQKTLVQQSLVPLFFRCHDEKQCVAEASRETLLCAASFLKRRDLEQLLRKQQHFEFCDCLMDKDVSRRDEHLRQALPYLQSPQQPLRDVAVRFMGVAAWHMKDLQPIMKALEVMTEDDCPSSSTMRTAVLSAFRWAVTK
ncbi:PREDICTED: maestro heat-like repeat-containing protein family member 7 isoform X2 [Lepidothrix coronata]|uniref:Maestro heat-like repeat-containing protein family member 7 isoform X2 n=1 Tax=Lepidothrix coronata TaxID=321398 RepID=A0A6J0GLV3_9PASS|nr:PREDICTED: maestro heat-like repeat-containing protein family member 7 isoform X2 [Lepidothrix coronata]